MAHFLIIGAGIGGLTTALALQQQGHSVQVCEAAPELREVGAGVVLGANAMRALDQLGVHDAVRAAGHPVSSICLLDQHGGVLNEVVTTAFTQRLGYDNLAIHRARLQQVLLAQLPPGTVQLNRAFERFEQTPTGVVAQFRNGASARADALIGADGIWSRVRGQLLPASGPRYAGYTCWRGVVDAAVLRLPAGRTTETWGRHGRFGCVPLPDGHVYWFACVNSPTARNARFRAWQLADLQRQFADYHFPIPEVLALTRPEQVLWNDILDLKPLRQFAYGRVLLLGDAAHATTPNMGQGAGQAVEDAAVLADCLAHTPALETAFERFDQRRRPRTTRIVNQSWQLGKAAQLTHPLLVALRNAVMRHVPARLNARQMQFLYESA